MCACVLGEVRPACPPDPFPLILPCLITRLPSCPVAPQLVALFALFFPSLHAWSNHNNYLVPVPLSMPFTVSHTSKAALGNSDKDEAE